MKKTGTITSFSTFSPDIISYIFSPAIFPMDIGDCATVPAAIGLYLNNDFISGVPSTP